MKKVKMNKRGNIVLDLALFMIILFACALAFYVVHTVWLTIEDEVLVDADLRPNADINQTYDNITSWMNTIPFIFLLMFGGVVAFLIISALYIDTFPGFFIYAFFGLIILIIVSAYLANAYNEFVTDSEFTETHSHFGAMDRIILYFPLVILLIGGIVLVLLYGKPGR